LSIFEKPETGCYKVNFADKVDWLGKPIRIPYVPDAKDDALSITDRCPATNRLSVASLYVEALSQSSQLDSASKEALLVEFNETIYKSVLDDVAHLVKEHDSDILRVQKEWQSRYGLAKCLMSECGQSQRHYTRNRAKHQLDGDGLYSFYEALFDQIHHFVFHLHDVGMRVDTQTMWEEITDNKPDELTVDKLFEMERDRIKTKREQSNVDLNRFDDETNKFTISTAVRDETETNLTDALFEDLAIRNQALDPIHSFLNRYDFDSDAMEMDLQNTADSNLCTFIDDQTVTDSMRTFIDTINLRRSAFSTGFKFDYWVKDDSMRPWDSVLGDVPFVEAIYKDLKTEILSSGLVELAIFDQQVMLKAEKYLKSEKVLQIKADKLKQSENKYNPQPYREITVQHLCSVILYCDMTLCTKYSATFRRNNIFENDKSVMKRHSHFVHFAKLLVEMVFWFGTCKYDGGDGGPFFCGINCVLNLGTFAVCFNGPCSTSKQRAVALNFADNGLILKVDNNDRYAQHQKFLDCTWISCYMEEAERLWITGMDIFALRIVSIINVLNPKNYQKQLQCLYLFDLMLSGGSLDGSTLKEEQSDVDWLAKLITLTLSGGDIGTMGFDDYLQREWRLFLQNKTEITLDLYNMYDYFKKLSTLIMSNVVKTKNPKGMDNVMRTDVASMFPSLQTMTIKNSGRCSFRLPALLELMQSISSLDTVIIFWFHKWIKGALTDDISAEFGASGWSFKYDEKYDNGDGRWVINKSKLE